MIAYGGDGFVAVVAVVAVTVVGGEEEESVVVEIEFLNYILVQPFIEWPYEENRELDDFFHLNRKGFHFLIQTLRILR